MLLHFCTGMMWMRQFSNSDMNLRHTCEQGDRLQGYSWLMHDGLTFGVQEMRDNDFTLTTEFVKRIGGDHGGDWTWRITAKQHVSVNGVCCDVLQICPFKVRMMF